MDIEKLLQQYGEDQRQQQHAAKHLKRMARNQRRGLIGVGCAVAVLVSTVLMVNLPENVQQTGSTPVARQSTPLPHPDGRQQVLPAVDSHSDTPQTATTAMKESRPPQSEVSSCSATAQTPDLIADMNNEATPSTDPVAPPEYVLGQPSDTSDTAITLPETPPLQQQIPSDPRLLIEPPLQTAENTDSHSDSRLRFTASVGTSSMSLFGTVTEYGPATGQSGFGEINSPITTITPQNSFSAVAGVTYAIVSKETMSSSVGLVVNGQAQRSEVTTYTLVSGVDPISGTTTDFMVATPDGSQINSTFSLYVGIPLIFNMQPFGSGHAGWNISLTPSHLVASPQQLRANFDNPFSLNPWRLNLGIGVTLPQRFPRSISITTNLLPVYTAKPIHEIGIELGF